MSGAGSLYSSSRNPASLRIPGRELRPLRGIGWREGSDRLRRARRVSSRAPGKRPGSAATAMSASPSGASKPADAQPRRDGIRQPAGIDPQAARHGKPGRELHEPSPALPAPRRARGAARRCPAWPSAARHEPVRPAADHDDVVRCYAHLRRPPSRSRVPRACPTLHDPPAGMRPGAALPVAVDGRAVLGPLRNRRRKKSCWSASSPWKMFPSVSPVIRSMSSGVKNLFVQDQRLDVRSVARERVDHGVPEGLAASRRSIPRSGCTARTGRRSTSRASPAGAMFGSIIEGITMSM